METKAKCDEILHICNVFVQFLLHKCAFLLYIYPFLAFESMRKCHFLLLWVFICNRLIFQPFHRFATVKCKISNLHILLRIINYNFKIAASNKSSILDACHTLRNINASQSFTSRKCGFSDACHTLWNVYASQTVAF